jgi:uncharacterized protein
VPVTSLIRESSTAPKTASLQRKVEFLSRSDSYPEGTAAVEVVQTHVCVVFLTDRFAYKLKKPVQHPFLDFRTLAARQRDCNAEIRLNRRLAPDVYLKTEPLRLSPRSELQLGGNGDIVDWLVKMRRLPKSLMLDEAIRRGSVNAASVQQFARVLIGFYRRSQSVELSADAYRRRYRRDIEANCSALAHPDYELAPAQIEAITRIQLDVLSSDARMFDRRIIDCHGDLRPEHICLSDPPVFIDCLEFKREYRLLDPVDELSYLALECELQGAAFVGEAVLASYRERMPDEFPHRLVDFHKAYRATLRAKLALWHLRDHDIADRARWLTRARNYLSLAAHYCGRL